ncbi:hypothetical protein LTR78_007703 [Recurvomyces mirabilis]|uniref:Mitochondrial carrier n=1 Tax=Recurvomyces mirabilis TaxID=574656 RepID=A0AAE0TU00_9PEZI|nr:hypothetical protein LTR78_007703 [Recurvomyces mirabilis]KAK5151590.1 hypothetical protein LTS14_009077 [Recurvomyces mirabilis]
MSTTVKQIASSAASKQDEEAGLSTPKPTGKNANYKGFVAGVFSGIAKLSVGHPFDTIKVRLQTSTKTQFTGPIDCLLQTVRKEGFSGLYKGATPPLIGWMCMDSLMLGSLTLYRRLLNENVFQPLRARPTSQHIWKSDAEREKLPPVGHGMAGMLAGWTVSFIAAPIEHVKARLQIQYQANKSQRLYSGPLDCTRRIYTSHGLPGLWHGLRATLLFRTFFFFWWGSYDLFTTYLTTHTSLSTPAINFWAGGLSAQVYWLTSYPSDVVKQRIMTDPLEVGKRKYPRWRDAARAVYREGGARGYWRGFVPCFLRAFPANAAALVAFEGVMRHLD